MTREQILQMARECGLGMMLQDETTHGAMWEEELERFANLVEQRTREECIQAMWEGTDNMHDAEDFAFKEIIEDAIRATSTLQASKVEGR